MTVIQALALAPPLLAALAERGPAMLGVLATALALSLSWELAFALARARGLTCHGVTTALIVAVMVPVTVPLLQLGLAVSLGVVLGELIFGGRGFGFLNAGVATLAFLAFSFPGATLAVHGVTTAVATLPGAALLLAAGLISWRVVVAAGVAFVAVALAVDAAASLTMASVALAFGLVFLVSDPLAAAATNPGRWLYGVLVGGLTAVFHVSTGGAALVFAALLGSIFAPLIDHLVVLALARRWMHGHG